MKRKTLLFILLFAVFGLLQVTSAYAQSTLTVCDGEVINDYVPLYGFYADTEGTSSEFIIPATNLTAMNNMSITAMTFYLESTAEVEWGHATFFVYMKEVENTEISDITGHENCTVVYMGELSGNKGTMAVPFDNEYLYHGGNLLIGTYVEVGGDFLDESFYGIDTDYNSSYSVYDDFEYGIVEESFSFLPKTTFTYSSPTTCPKPKNLVATELTSSSTTIRWIEKGSATDWLLQVGTDEEFNNIGNYDEYEISTDPEKDLDLTVGTTYYARVKSICTQEDQSEWSSVYEFKAPCVVESMPYEYGFEIAETLECWTLVNCSEDNIASSPTQSDNHSFAFDGDGTIPQYLISPELNGLESIKVEFYYINAKTYWTESFQVGYSTYASFDAFTWGDEITCEDDENWEKFEKSFPVGTKYIAIKYNSEDGYFLFIDDIKLDIVPIVFESEGNWNDSEKWSIGEIPAATDDVTINATCTIPDGYCAQVNSITIGEEGSILMAEGGQLVCNNAVEVTALKNIQPYTIETGTEQDPTDGWYFIASPLDGEVIPEDVENMLCDPEDGIYDLYRLSNTTWDNYKNQTQHPDFTSLVNGSGYLYANSNEVTLEFSGAIKPYSEEVEDNQVTLAYTGWNLVGNPFTYDVTINKPFGELNNGSAITNKTTGTIKPCEGVLVNGEEGDKVTFTRYVSEGSPDPNPSNLQLTLSQTVTSRGHTLAKTVDNAIMSFNEGTTLPKFRFGNNAEIYIPQGNEDYAIAFSDQQGEMPVNFKAFENGSYTLQVTLENVTMSYLHLIDHFTGTDVDLLTTPSYTFDAHNTDYEARFKLVFQGTSVNEDHNNNLDDFAFISNGQLIVNGEGTLQIFDVLGHQLLANQQLNNSTTQQSTATFSPGVYVLRLINSRQVRIQKIIVP